MAGQERLYKKSNKRLKINDYNFKITFTRISAVSGLNLKTLYKNYLTRGLNNLLEVVNDI